MAPSTATEQRALILLCSEAPTSAPTMVRTKAATVAAAIRRSSWCWLACIGEQFTRSRLQLLATPRLRSADRELPSTSPEICTHMQARLQQLILYVSDMARSITFYHHVLGLTLRS